MHALLGLVLSLLGAGCGTTGTVVGALGPHGDDLCPRGEVTALAPAAAIKEGQRLVRVGCPSAALARVDPHAAKDTSAWLVQVEALQDSVDQTLVGPARWMPLSMGASSQRRRATDLDGKPVIERMTRVVDRFKAPQAPPLAVGRILTRLRTTPVCMDGTESGIPDARVKAIGRLLRDGFVGVMQERWRPRDKADQLRLRALEALWECKLDEAANTLQDAARAYAASARPIAAATAALHAIERRVFPGGRAADMTIGTFGDGPLEHRAALEEAASAGYGDYATRADALDPALDRWAERYPVASKTPALAGMAAWYRAVAAIRLRRAPSAAKRHAAEAARLARTAGRADVLDAARAVELLAAVEQEADDVEPRLERLFDSLQRRGAHATVFYFGVQVQYLAYLLARRGELQRAVDLLKAGRNASRKHLSSMHLSMAVGYARTLTETGRFGDARLAVATAREALKKADKSVAMFPFDAQLTVLDLQLRIALGDTQAIIDQARLTPNPVSNMTSSLMAAFDSGDAAAVAKIMAAPRNGHPSLPVYVPSISADLGICDSSAALHNAARILRVSFQRLSERILSGTDTLTLVKQFGAALNELNTTSQLYITSMANCATARSDPSLVDAARALGRTVLDRGGAPSPERAAYMKAARLEAEGRYVEAGNAYLQALRRNTERLKNVRVMAVGSSEQLGYWHGRAARAFLRASPPRIEEAIQSIETGRAGDLRAARVKRARVADGPRLAELIALERKLGELQARSRALVQLIRRTKGKARDAIETKLRAMLARSERIEMQRGAMARKLKGRDQAAYRAALVEAPPTVAQLQKRLGADETLLLLYSDRMFGFGIVIDRTKAVAVPFESLDAKGLPRMGLALRQLRQQAGPDGDPTEALKVLGKRMLQPLLPHIPAGRRVIVVPSGEFAAVPLAAVGPPERPWIARNPLRFLHSAALLEPAPKAGKRWTTPPPAEVLIVGDPAYEATSSRGGTRARAAFGGWQRLPGTRDEALAIGKLLAASPLLGAEATEPAVLKRLGNARWVHLATHGLAEVLDPTQSALVLSMPKTTRGVDGVLHGYEVERVPLKADLVVLSACETGRGTPRGSEGVLALDRSFLAAGAKTVVSSLWLVGDEATSRLMQAFYRHLAKGVPADVAMARAMNKLRRQDGFGDVALWAAFRVVGAGLR